MTVEMKAPLLREGGPRPDPQFYCVVGIGDLDKHDAYWLCYFLESLPEVDRVLMIGDITWHVYIPEDVDTLDALQRIRYACDLWNCKPKIRPGWKPISGFK